MMQRKIRLTPQEVQQFVTYTMKCDFDVNIAYNRYVVDAKSFLGIMGLDFRQVLNVSYDGYNQDFEDYLRKFEAVAC